MAFRHARVVFTKIQENWLSAPTIEEGSYKWKEIMGSSGETNSSMCILYNMTLGDWILQKNELIRP